MVGEPRRRHARGRRNRRRRPSPVTNHGQQPTAVGGHMHRAALDVVVVRQDSGSTVDSESSLDSFQSGQSWTTTDFNNFKPTSAVFGV